MDSGRLILRLEKDFIQSNSSVKNRLTAHPKLDRDLLPVVIREDDILYIFILTDQERELVVRPALAGKYSKIDRQYVDAFFKKVFIHPIKKVYVQSRNWQVLHRDEKLRQEMEEYLDVTIEPEAELLDKPFPEREILDYGEKTPISDLLGDENLGDRQDNSRNSTATQRSRES
jgi:hypothetical protein